MGRKTSCPVALEAVISPITSPRRWLNQRVATVAPSTSAVIPVPTPMTTPQSRTICQTSVMKKDATIPPAIIASAVAVTCRTPKRFMKAAANGPSRPNSISRIASAVEISALVQPNSSCRGSSSTPAEPSAPAVASMVRKVTPAATQP